MGTDKIKKKIMGDADREAKKTLAAAEQERDRIRAANKERRDAYKRSYEEHTASLAKLYEQKTLAHARLEAKKAALRRREELIDQHVDAVIAKADAKAHAGLLEGLLKRAGQDLGKRLVVRCRKQDAAAVKRLAKKLKLTVTVKEAALSGGLLVQDAKGRKIDDSLEAVLGRRRQELRQAVAKLLEV